MGRNLTLEGISSLHIRVQSAMLELYHRLEVHLAQLLPHSAASSMLMREAEPMLVATPAPQ